jgi:hypothetical protein
VVERFAHGRKDENENVYFFRQAQTTPAGRETGPPC